MGIFKNMGQFARNIKDDFFPKKGTPAYEGKMELRRINRRKENNWIQMVLIITPP